MAMMTKNEIIQELEKGTGSTDYRGWLSHLLRHIERYGEEPKFEQARFLDWNTKSGGIKEITKKNKILRNYKSYVVVAKNGDIYEVDEGSAWSQTVIKILDIEHYKNWKSPMCYNEYIEIL